MKRSAFFKNFSALIAAPLMIATATAKKFTGRAVKPPQTEPLNIPTNIVRIVRQYKCDEVIDAELPRIGDVLVSDLGHFAYVSHSIWALRRGLAPIAEAVAESTIIAVTVDGQPWRYNDFFDYKVVRRLVGEGSPTPPVDDPPKKDDSGKNLWLAALVK